ncbi:Rho-binding antiterminator [Shewanella marina]|uniref:Rho-binding antiterminator n=1 Tax=Shewanella marina TaxID=487319 RepID=UPI00046EF184|nr:Rho-binding antiterminator [Shewanella marina]
MISCDRHDYIEIACLYRLHIELSLLDGSKIEGIANTTITKTVAGAKQEYLILGVNGEAHEVALEQIKTMRAIETNPHFDVIQIQA